MSSGDNWKGKGKEKRRISDSTSSRSYMRILIRPPTPTPYLNNPNCTSNNSTFRSPPKMLKSEVNAEFIHARQTSGVHVVQETI